MKNKIDENKDKIGHIEDEKIINKINNALGVSFGLEE